MSWGLQYTALERLGGPSRHEGRVGGPFRQEGRLGKRKADTDNGSRRVRAREGQDDDSATGSESACSQNVDDHESQPSRMVTVQVPVQVRVPLHTEERNEDAYGDHHRGNLLELIRAADREVDNWRYQEYREPSEHTRLEWRVGSTPSTERRRWRRWYAQLDGERPEEPSQSATREEVSSEEL